MPPLSRLLNVLAIACLGLAAPGAPALAASADIRMTVCENAICPWFKISAAPPPNWVEDSEYGDPRQMTVFGIPNQELPFIYVSASEVGADSRLAKNVARNQSSWLAEHPDSRFRPLGATGQFSVYEVKNPSVPQQPYELMAFTQRTFTIRDRSYTLFIQAVLTGSDKAEVAGHLKDLKAFIKHFDDPAP